MNGHCERKMQAKSLSQVLQEKQEEALVVSKGKMKRGRGYRLSGQGYELSSSSSSATTLREAAARILEPRLHSCTTVRYLVHLDRMANFKNSKRLRKSHAYVDEELSGKNNTSASNAAELLLNALGLSRFFVFNNKNRGATGQRKNKYNLLKSILTRVAPSKECIKDASSASELGFSNAPRPWPEVQGSEEARLRIYDIVRWNSFQESEFLDIYENAGHSRTSLVREKESRGDVISSTCFSSLERKVSGTGKGNVEDFSFSSSSSEWLESSLDSDRGSNSTGRSSSSDCSELKGIDPDPDPCNLEESYFSLEIDRAGDFDHSPRSAVNIITTKPQMCEAVCNRYEGSVTCIQKDYMRAPSTSITTPLNFMPEIDEVTSTDDVKSDSTDIEENKCAPYMNKRVSERGSKVSNENSEEEQQSPISVLDSLTYGLEFQVQQRGARKHVLKKICEYEQLAQMNPVVLQCTTTTCPLEEVTVDTDKLVEMELMSGREEWKWKRFTVEREEIGIKIEVAIFRLLLEDLLLDLLAF
ncbi:uncharacterized protein LOC131069789 isoform X2 [Cryptomeria japonica]|uniref:uncharacterized protein LOC131069789 isoform X2 n=1 Tax=Cryptomeria japonica TaxID=3369 RepID=UPI0027DA8E28|nr:uncharacterized protein LOC131069789 isoform X2 [Cryptomeria japonica]